MDIINLNKQYRGQIMRIIARLYPTAISVRQIKIALVEYGVTYKADVDKHLFYLEDKKYIKFKEETSEFKKDDDTVKITALGIDLVEGTITDDGILM